MSSYEDRMRAVELYIRVGKRAAATIRQLGYPTKTSLKTWYEDYRRDPELPARYAQLKPRYSLSQKMRAVEHYIDHGRCMAVIIRALGYRCRDLVNAWIHERHPELRKRVSGPAKGLPRLAALKQVGVIALCARQESEKAAAKKLSVSRPTLYK